MGRRLALDVGKQAGRPRLDLFLARRLPTESRSSIQRLILAGRVHLEGRSLRPSHRLKAGDRILVEFTDPEPVDLVPENIPIEVQYEDADLLVVVKPAGMVVHPGAGVRAGTLVHALLGRGGSLSRVGGGERPGIVHRLDRETSGLLVVARNEASHRALSSQFASRSVTKIYQALAWGHPAPPSGKIEAPVGRHPVTRTRMAVRVRGGRAALTEYRTLERLGPLSLLEVRIRTGRTHQIRVHLKHFGHPVAGDARYGGASPLRAIPEGPAREALTSFGRLALHAFVLEFDHPRDGRRLRFQAPLPEDFSRLLEELRRGS